MIKKSDAGKIAIIGGAGFLGYYLKKELDSVQGNYHVFDINADESSPTESLIDVISISDNFDLEECDIIVNLAAEHRDDVRPASRYYDVNVCGAEQICALAERRGLTKIIFVSSVAIYGFAEANTDETGEPNFFNEYGRTKWLAEEVYRHWYNKDPSGRCLTIIRPTVIFGPRNRGNVYNLLNQIDKKLFVMIGSGENVKSMAYVENVASFLRFCVSTFDGYQLTNYVDKPDLNMNQLVTVCREKLFGKSNVGVRLPTWLGMITGYTADIVSKLTSRSLPVSAIRVKKFTATTQFDSSARRLGFDAPHTLEEGLTNTLAFEFQEDHKGESVFHSE
jgi:nucleoside-diphosphate-sugar epimerase